MFIDSLYVENIRSIATAKIPLSKINILIGKNASGKSSILYSLLALQNLSQGNSTSKWAFQNMTWLQRRGVVAPMHICLEGNANLESNTHFKLDCKFTPSLAHNSRLNVQEDAIIEIATYGGKHDIEPLGLLDDVNHLKERLERLSERMDPFGYGAILGKGGVPIHVREGSTNLLASWINFDYDYFSEGTGAVFKKIRKEIRRYILDMEFISVNRGSFFLHSPQSDSKPKKITDGESAPHEFLNMLIYPDLLDKIAFDTVKEWAAKFGITDFEVVIQPGRQVEGRGLVYDTQKLPISLYGFGSNQFLHLIAKCVFSAPNAPILIEEPEIHLHPEFQALSMDFLIDTMRANHQIFITTHSEHLIGRIQRRIAEGVLSPNDVSILWVRHDSEEEGTVVEKVEIDLSGIFDEGLTTYLKFIQDEMAAIESARHHRNNTR